MVDIKNNTQMKSLGFGFGENAQHTKVMWKKSLHIMRTRQSRPYHASVSMKADFEQHS